MMMMIMMMVMMMMIMTMMVMMMMRSFTLTEERTEWNCNLYSFLNLQEL